MNNISIIPTSKFDINKIECIRNAKDEEILCAIDQLFEWLEDPNWPIALPLSDILITKLYLLHDKLHQILSREYQNTDLKAAVLYLIFFRNIQKIDFRDYIEDWKRIMQNPTENEKSLELNDYAKILLEMHVKN